MKLLIAHKPLEGGLHCSPLGLPHISPLKDVTFLEAYLTRKSSQLAENNSVSQWKESISFPSCSLMTMFYSLVIPFYISHFYVIRKRHSHQSVLAFVSNVKINAPGLSKYVNHWNISSPRRKEQTGNVWGVTSHSCAQQSLWISFLILQWSGAQMNKIKCFTNSFLKKKANAFAMQHMN